MAPQFPIDIDRLLEILGRDNVEIVSEMLALFTKTFPALTSLIEIALSEQSLEKSLDAAHAAISASH